jgi:hypothetical protein
MEGTTATVADEPLAVPADGYMKTVCNLFLSPSRAFATLALTRWWLIPLVICALVTVGYEAATSQYRMADMRDRISHDSTLTPQDVSRRLANIDAQGTTTISLQQLAIGSTVLTVRHVLKVLSLAGVLWLAVRIFTNSATYGKLLSTTSFVFLLAVPEQIVKALLITVKGSYQVFLGPAILLPAEWYGSPLFEALDRLDIFGIWMAALTAVALPMVSGISKRQAVVTVGCLWIVWLLLAMLPIRVLEIT